ncbi:MAG: hypothetical protein JW963_06695 [Anaerolineales bacterium]|nr:hypothetical protein [Anaerolineales bacterium]
MIKTSHWLAFIAVVCILLTSWGSVQAQTPDSEYFAQTGHSVNGDFLRYYRSVPNPTLVFGYPLTEQFTSKDGKTVQYFQRARFEQSANSINLTPLGRETYTPEKQLVINNPLACRTFSETGYSVCFAFLEFFEQNGGVAQFGYPISPFEFRNNQIVQYFENARFEWRPGLAEGQRIGLTDLGRIYFDQIDEDPAFLKPSTQGVSGPNLVLDLQVRAFPNKAVATSSDQQTIYVLVQDQNLQPIAGANGVATIRLPNGEVYSQSFPVNERGVGTFSFNFQNQQNGQLVYINIAVTYSGLQGTTSTSFRIWY